MEQNQISIEQYLNSKINQKAQKVIGELSAKLFEAEAKAELLQELYNKSQKELEEVKGQVAAEEAKKNELEAKVTENTLPSTEETKSRDDAPDINVHKK